MSYIPYYEIKMDMDTRYNIRDFDIKFDDLRLAVNDLNDYHNRYDSDNDQFDELEIQDAQIESLEDYRPLKFGLNKEKISEMKTLKSNDSETKCDCSICLEKYNKEEKLLQAPCGHIFHYECICKWFMNNTNCPLCREEFDAEKFFKSI